MSVHTAIEIADVTQSGALQLNSTAPGQFEIVKNGAVIGAARLPENANAILSLYQGKGGLTAILGGKSGLKYFGLPGSRMAVGGVEVELFGEPVTGDVQRAPHSGSRTPAQRHTKQAMILGAGLATRFEPISGVNTGYSKPAVPLAGSLSVIRCIAENLARDGFTRLFINTYFMPDSLKASLEGLAGVEIRYIDEEAPSGTAGALRKLLEDPRYADWLDVSQPILIIQGDAVTDADFSELLNAHAQQGAALTIGCQVVPEKDVDKFGIIVTDRAGGDGESGGILEFQEKPSPAEAKSRLGNTGFYVFSPKVFGQIRQAYAEHLTQSKEKAKASNNPEPEWAEFDFAKDLFPRMLAWAKSGQLSGPFWAHYVRGYWSDIGNPAQYLESVHDVFAGRVDLPLPQPREDYYDAGVLYWPGAKALAQEEGAELSGNVVVAKPFQA